MRGSQSWRTNRSRVLRAQDTAAEARVWNELRDRQLGGFKFTRQAPIGPYFVDFVCRKKKLIVEVDGATHSLNEEIAADAARTSYFETLGYRVIRIANEDVERNLDGVLDELLHEIETS